jgi:hypothetical protein
LTTIVPASRIAAATDVVHLIFAFFIASLSRIAYEMGRSGLCTGGARVVGEVGATFGVIGTASTWPR